MSYQALYRRYRPKYFRDVIGQDHITTTLRNQVISGRIAHAYLFCGTRGTGKTTMARIFSNAINCEHPVDGEPCYDCPACRASLEGALDVIEIDGASNTGVDNVREIIEKAQMAPIRGKYKVYIIDEVHMLSGSAFNALLKTLEEPPQQTIFILATTEPHKLLPTVLSRCQRYEFHRMTVELIYNHLKEVLADIGAQIDDDGMFAIARAADGGMRDALSLTDQCIAFCGNDITGEQVLSVLGSMNPDFLFELVDALLRADEREVLLKLDSLLQKGRDLGVLVQDLSAHFRNLLLISACGDASSLIECTKETYARYCAQAKKCPPERALRALELLSKVEGDIKWLNHPRVQVETTLLRICRPEDETTVEALLDRIGTLERRLAAGEFTAAAPAQPAAEQPKDGGARQEDDLPPWEEETPPPPEEPPFDPEESAAQAAPKTQGKEEEIFQLILSVSSQNIQALAQTWPHTLSGNQFVFRATGMNELALKALQTRTGNIQKAISEKFPGVELVFLPGNASLPTGGGFKEKAQQVFGQVEETD